MAGAAQRSQFLDFPAGSGPGERAFAELTSVSNDALDRGNIIFLEICDPLDDALLTGEPLADGAEVLVTDDDSKLIV